ncbi:MAG: alpha-L-fucosidase [Luteolibacter sp.]
MKIPRMLATPSPINFRANSLVMTLSFCACLAVLAEQPNSPPRFPAAPKVAPPKPFGATPSEAQVKQAERAFYAFCHFTVDTFTDREWGTGGESESVFNPTAFDADQIVKALKSSTAAGVILTAKHHDGFCLWPTATTEHNISASPYRNGKGDIVREFADACARNDFEFGIYVSPWDRNHPAYGTPDYLPVYRKQIEELTTKYGKLFEIWFDGANGGSGYYQGKVGPVESKDVNKNRAVDRLKYYEWPETWAMVQKKQPGIIIFSDVGPGVRWVGNERGHAPDPSRATITFEPGDSVGHIDESKLGPGTLHGTSWCPAEVDVSIRPGWFWHESQNGKVRSPENLMEIYLASIGHGTTFNLNVPPDRRGLIHENDAASLRQFGEHLRQTFGTNLAQGATCVATNVRGKDAFYGPARLLDQNIWSAWVSDDEVKTPEVTLELTGEKQFNMVRLREDIRLGLRVEGVAVDAWVDGAWKELAKAESIGSCHLWRIPKTATTKVRVRVTKSEVAPALSDFGLFLEPGFDTWVPPVGGDPKVAAKAGWKIAGASYEAEGGEARRAIDGDTGTLWHTHGGDGEHHLPQDFSVDMGKEKTLKGFTYTPRTGTLNGVVDQYAFATSIDGKTWTTAAEGEFGNLRANLIEQTVPFTAVKARFFKFTAKHALEKNHAAVAEIGVVEADGK